MNTQRTSDDKSKPRTNLPGVRPGGVVSGVHIVVPVVHTSKLDAEYGCVEWFNYAGSPRADTQRAEVTVNPLEKNPQSKCGR